MSSEVETSLDALAFKKKSRFLNFARNDRRRGCHRRSEGDSFARGVLCIQITIMNPNESAQDFPYKTYLNILHRPLEVIDVQKLANACTDKWYNQTLCKVNESVVRLAVIQGEYHWHEHKDIDEFFFVLDGHFLIDLEDRVVDLAPRQGFVVPKGVRHRTRAPERAVILMVERADIVPTGD
jgi:mannose-6-phosphate isomerase-like protein (cupin superfamily)